MNIEEQNQLKASEAFYYKILKECGELLLGSDESTSLLPDKIRALQADNAAQWELTSTLGAPNHINIPVEKWRELREDKERLDSGTILLTVNGERVHHIGVDLRAAIDAARKEIQP